MSWLTWQFSVTNAAFVLVISGLAVLFMMREVKILCQAEIQKATTKALANLAGTTTLWNVIDVRLGVVEQHLTELDVRVVRLSSRTNIRISVPNKNSNSGSQQ